MIPLATRKTAWNKAYEGFVAILYYSFLEAGRL